MKLVVGLLISIASVSAIAQGEFLDSTKACNCQYENLGSSCSAEIGKVGEWITISTNTKQCARVDWISDGQPNVSVVSNGVFTSEWLGPNSSPALSVEFCRICGNQDASIDDSSEGAWDRMIAEKAHDVYTVARAEPEYPRRARIRMLEGAVLVRYDVDRRGRATNATVKCSSNEIFDQAAIEAVLGSSYKPRVVDGVSVYATGLEKKISFELEGGSGSRTLDCQATTETRNVCAMTLEDAKYFAQDPVDEKNRVVRDQGASRELAGNCEDAVGFYDVFIARQREHFDNEFLDSVKACNCQYENLGEFMRRQRSKVRRLDTNQTQH